ncbi:hypothetical protein MAR_001930 [Mya arenaria]|uniref:Uncharacterized protein n=1 Tax=Mya arenaria TaxID=6604 RepID=A0ABY7FD91_MYAAR|nr:hypothetical protein MAR_001930 [Mya arenaria]
MIYESSSTGRKGPQEPKCGFCFCFDVQNCSLLLTPGRGRKSMHMKYNCIPSTSKTRMLFPDWTVSIRDGVPVLFDDHQVAVKSPSYINNRTVKLKDALSSVELVFNAERDARLHDTVVAELDNLHVKGADVLTLLDNNWENDQIVNFYMHVLKRNYVDIEVVDVFFVTAVTSKRNPEKYLPPGWIQRNRLGDVSRIRKIMVHEILSGSLFEEP